MPEVFSQLYKQITVSGADAVGFLQGQLTQDVGRLAHEGRLLAAWCDPKGRVIAVVRLLDLGDSIGMIVPAALAERLVERLKLYRLRSKVDFAVSDPAAGAVLPSEADIASLVDAGVAHIDESNSALFTPHMLNLDHLGAISFTKGCYTGQEIVARTEHRGRSRRRLMRYEAATDGVHAGMRLSDGESDVGVVVNVAGRRLLAVTPVELHDRPLGANGIVITPIGLPYDL